MNFGLMGKRGEMAHKAWLPSNFAHCDLAHRNELHSLSNTPLGRKVCRRCLVLAPLHEKQSQAKEVATNGG